MNDLTTRNHSDLNVIEADAREDFNRALVADAATDVDIDPHELPHEWPVEDDDIDYEGEDDFGDYDDGQPSEYEEWQDVFGGDDYVYGSYGMDDAGGFDME